MNMSKLKCAAITTGVLITVSYIHVILYRLPAYVRLHNNEPTHMIDAQAWGGSLAPGRSVDILYKSANPSRIRLANNPTEITLMGPVKAALLFLIPGLLLAFLSRRR